MRITKQQFIDRLKPEEMAGLLAAAKVNVSVEAWLFRFNSVTPDQDGTSIDLNDTRTVAGLHQMELAGLLGKGRAAEILATSVSAPGDMTEHQGIRLGDTVRILPPFDESFPTPVAVESISAAEDGSIVFTLRDSGGFARDYLELIK